MCLGSKTKSNEEFQKINISSLDSKDGFTTIVLSSGFLFVLFCYFYFFLYFLIVICQIFSIPLIKIVIKTIFILIKYFSFGIYVQNNWFCFIIQITLRKSFSLFRVKQIT